VKEVISHLKAYIEAHPDVSDDTNRWIEGMGWDQTKWPGAQFPTAVRFRLSVECRITSFNTSF
jgi:hypothetical protein